MRSRLARLLDRRRSRRETRAQIQWGLGYIYERYGHDGALTAWPRVAEQGWYTQNAQRSLTYVQRYR